MSSMSLKSFTINSMDERVGGKNARLRRARLISSTLRFSSFDPLRISSATVIAFAGGVSFSSSRRYPASLSASSTSDGSEVLVISFHSFSVAQIRRERSSSTISEVLVVSSSARSSLPHASAL